MIKNYPGNKTTTLEQISTARISKKNQRKHLKMVDQIRGKASEDGGSDISKRHAKKDENT